MRFDRQTDTNRHFDSSVKKKKIVKYHIRGNYVQNFHVEQVQKYGVLLKFKTFLRKSYKGTKCNIMHILQVGQSHLSYLVILEADKGAIL